MDEVKPGEIEMHCCWENKDVAGPVRWKRGCGKNKSDWRIVA